MSVVSKSAGTATRRARHTGKPEGSQRHTASGGWSYPCDVTRFRRYRAAAAVKARQVTRRRGRLHCAATSCVGFVPDARYTPQPIKAPPTPGIGDGTLKVVVHAREVEYTTEQTDSAHARVGKTLWPQTRCLLKAFACLATVGRRGGERDEVAFDGVELGADCSGRQAFFGSSNLECSRILVPRTYINGELFGI
jgi:hypothetical protein